MTEGQLRLGISYQPNDSTTPDLVTEVATDLPSPCPPFSVAGWTGNVGLPGTPEHHAALVQTSITVALKTVQANLDNPLTHWQSNQNLLAIPRAGNDLNAYYDRVALRFFYNMDNVTKKMVYACESSDVVSHELGHAILDSMRPDLWGTASLEIFAFHEAFGDIIAMSSLLTHPVVVERVLKETNGDLMVPNVVSRVAEELGAAIFHATGGRAGHADCLRSAINNFQYVDPATLPTSGQELIQEPHSFSQIFTGAWYDILVGIYNTMLSGATPADCLRRSRDFALMLLFKAVLKAASAHNFFASMGRAIIAESKTFQHGIFATMITEVFAKRKIVDEVPHMSMFDSSIIDPGVEGHQARLTLAAPIFGLARLVVDLPKKAASIDSAIDKALHAVHYAHHHNLIGEGKMFSIAEGKLTRNFICNAFCKEC